MPLYFFHLHNDMDVTDDEGTNLPDDAAARAYAIDNARDVATESIAKGYLNLDHYIEVMRADGAAVLRVRFGEAISVTGQAWPAPKQGPRSAVDPRDAGRPG